MALTLTFSTSGICPAGNHLTVTATLSSGQSRAWATSIPEIRATVTNEDLFTFVRVLLLLYSAQLTGDTPAQLRTAITSKVLDLTV